MKKHIVFDCDGTLVDTTSFTYGLYPGIKELLSDLSRDCQLYVWTARDKKSTVRILTELGIFHLFEAVCTKDDALPKPHVSGLSLLLGDVDKQLVCVVGDSSNDILGARSFGIKSIGALWNPGVSGLVLQDLGADFLAQRPGECLNWISLNLKPTS